MTAQISRARRNVIVLFAAQAILGAQMPMIFVVGALAGKILSPNPCMVTLPLSMIILGTALSARPLARFMQNHGRRAGFLLAVAAGSIGAMISAGAIWIGSFWLFMAGSLLTGVYMSAQGFYRFAATDTAPQDFAPKAISWVMVGGLFAAVIGPALVRYTDGMTAVPFLATYLAILALNLTGPFLFAFLDIPKPKPSDADADTGRSIGQLLAVPRIRVAMICGTVSYALMNLMMTSTSLAVTGCGFDQKDAANIISLHALSMFAPSFFTGTLITRYGSQRIVAIGMAILTLSGLIALAGVELANFYIALMLLGLGWNFGYIGATAMLTASFTPAERGRVQGINDAVVFGGVFLASLSSGALMNCAGGTAQQGWNAVTLTMLPFLLLAAASLIWLVRQERRQPALG
ncbi:MFS transporter [Paracoccus fistulariae]|uniref:MFS transporter n=1 Tax=Paracoccus fistulariae TaxID=658446 RepID=A0ABY7SNL8_9RHOB|nr:MFS transporter [Paracoccus fistulariae]MDB6179991.1 MFS transporter [Paracoccus fistulariae]WCR08082.1 MFS transporter [Paracoccus fistulariae]